MQGNTPKKPGRLEESFRHFACVVSAKLGSHWAFMAALTLVIVWAATGPLFHFSETWQLVINTSTTIVTFLMVFLIQSTQNRDAKALHLKLDELIRASRARNVFVDLEDATDEELDTFQREFAALRSKGVDHREALETARDRVFDDDEIEDESDDDEVPRAKAKARATA